MYCRHRPIRRHRLCLVHRSSVTHCPPNNCIASSSRRHGRKYDCVIFIAHNCDGTDVDHLVSALLCKLVTVYCSATIGRTALAAGKNVRTSVTHRSRRWRGTVSPFILVTVGVPPVRRHDRLGRAAHLVRVQRTTSATHATVGHGVQNKELLQTGESMLIG